MSIMAALFLLFVGVLALIGFMPQEAIQILLATTWLVLLATVVLAVGRALL